MGCKKEKKNENIKTTVGEETYLKYFDFGDMDSSLAYIKILDYWYWKVVDYRIQVTFGNIKNFLYYLTIHVQLNVLLPEIASVLQDDSMYQHNVETINVDPENN